MKIIFTTILIFISLATGLYSQCPTDEIISCTAYENFQPTPINTDGTACEGTGYGVEIDEVVGTCDSTYAYYVSITYTPIHGPCNGDDPCTQMVFVEKETIADLAMPADYDGLPGNEEPLSCEGNFAVDANGNPSTSVTGSPGGLTAGCAQITTTYSDNVVPICNTNCGTASSSYKVLRTWTLVEWCTSTTLNYTQVIKVMDTEAPIINAIPDMTISTNPWDCGATINLPTASAIDNCSPMWYITYEYSSTQGTRVGNSFVLDEPAYTGPNDPVIITVTASDCCGNSSSTNFNVFIMDLVPPVVNAESSRTIDLTTGGTGYVFAEAFDDGSHDNCDNIGFLVKRMDDGGSCASYDYFGDALGMGPNGIDDNAEYNEVVHFCCADVNEPVMVIFKVCDDADNNGIIGTAGDLCNSAMVEVIVQDKLAPEISCPPDVTISCIELASLGDLQALSDAFLNAQFGSASGSATCNISVEQTISGSDACGEGTVFRNFSATNSIGETVTCTQFITVSAGPTNFLTCDRINFEDLNNSLYSWCAVNDNTSDNDDDLPAIEIGCMDGLNIPQLDIDINGLCTEVGLNITIDTFDFANGACNKYLVHYEVIDQCQFDENYINDEGEIDPFNSDNGYFEFFIEVDAFDNEAPELDCVDITVTADVCAGFTGSFVMTGSDNCTNGAFFSYLFRFDLGATNTDITDFIQGPEISPSSLGLTTFPVGEHIIYWVVSDGCGNDATCAQRITVLEEDIQPTPYCIDGLSVAVMPSSGMVDLWAIDFNAGSFDNCDSTLTYSIVPEVDIDGLSDEEAYDLSFSNLQAATGEYGWTFDCTYIENTSDTLAIRIYVTDESGNWDYCTASLRLDDNTGVCSETGSILYTVSGEIKTEKGASVSQVEFNVEASLPEFPTQSMVDGKYSFDVLGNIDYTLIPAKHDNHMNGITTIDIVLIMKHILGVEEITSPYALIAADVNNDCQITGSDIVQLRKLLLGKYTDNVLPDNYSWRFIDKKFEFIDPANPCIYEEEGHIYDLQQEEVIDFVAVKVGDINGTVQTDQALTIETRIEEDLYFVLEDILVEKGTNRIEFIASDFNNIAGFQFELTANGAEFIHVACESLDISNNHFRVEGNSLRISRDFPSLKTVKNGEVLFAIEIDVEQVAKLSEILQINSTQILPEAYIGNELEIVETKLEYRTERKEIVRIEFTLSQNEPNPFKQQTVIRFSLPTTQKASLEIYDISGKRIYQVTDIYPAGDNEIVVERATIPATGVLYYQLESGGKKVTKRMVVVE